MVSTFEKDSGNDTVTRVVVILAAILSIGIALGWGKGASAQDPKEPREQPTAPMQTVSGQHIVLKSDGGSLESLTEMVKAFDAAVPQWERFWNLPAGTLARWKVHAFIISDRHRFYVSGDLPLGLDFPFGFAMSGNIWVMRQPSEYYTRHLLLHEGVHALAIEQFDSTGPSWYAEGLAEMLGVHRGSGDQVKINVIPKTREAAPYWGRFKLLSQRQSENRIPTIDAVMSYPLDLNSDVESYGWSWIAAMLLTEYPEYRPAMLQAAKNGADQSIVFSQVLQRQLKSQWPIVQARWRMLASTIDYGFDWSRERIEISIEDKLWNGKTFKKLVHANRGWQSAGGRFAPGMRLKITADGSCILNDQPKPWVSKPPGVTIHYAGGRPLGQLLVCVLPNMTSEDQRLEPLLEPLYIKSVESETEILVDKHCWILFRINDYLGDLENNRGGYTVTIRK